MRRLTILALAVGAAMLAASGSAAATRDQVTRHPVVGLPVSVALPASWLSVVVPPTITPAILKQLEAKDPVAAMFANASTQQLSIRFLGNEKPRKGHFTANLNLIVKPLPRGLTLREWFFAGQSAAMQYVGKTSTISNSGTPGLHYRSTKVMKAGTVPLLTEIYAFVYQGRIFDFTYTSGAADAQSYLPTFTASAGSIRFGTP
jgi:hypothetical protein